MMGTELRKGLFLNLHTGIWIDIYPKPRIAGFNSKFVPYAMAFCRELSRQLWGDPRPPIRGMARNLHNIAERPIHTRDGLVLSGFKKLAIEKAKQSLKLKPKIHTID